MSETMNNTKTSLAMLITGLTLSGLSTAETLSNAIASGKASIDMRYRIESVDQQGNPDKATAATLRTRLGYTTASYQDFKAHIDFEHVTEAGADDFNNTLNGKSEPVVADPMAEELNQAWIAYDGISNTSIKAGRQRIILDNARFIGNVGWRQNEQTFDAITISNTSIDNVTFIYSNVQQVNTITSGDTDVNANILNISIDKTPVGKITAYAYSIDTDNSTSDTLTLGARIKGSQDNFLYTAEYAQQSDTADNTADISASYLFIEPGMKMDQASIFLGYESLGSDQGTYGFQTPLATKHAFNGWADKFLATPVTGLIDLYVKAETKISDMKLLGVYHDYSADEGNIDYGKELNLVLIKPFSKNIKGLVKFADYSADAYATDTQKIWLALDMKFSQ